MVVHSRAFVTGFFSAGNSGFGFWQEGAENNRG
jgi:hypothetical protein